LQQGFAQADIGQQGLWVQPQVLRNFQVIG
jgi:hypothetical protein